MPSTAAGSKPDPKRPAKSGKSRQQQWLPRHDIFAEAIVSGRTIKDAFTLATGKPGGAGGSTAQSWLDWSLMKARITVLRAERLNRLALDRDQVILNLMDIYSNAMRADQYMAATRAMDQVAKLLDLYPTEKSQMEVHLIAKPATEPGATVELSVEDWKEQFSPREITQQ
jgi:hypothetical protein